MCRHFNCFKALRSTIICRDCITKLVDIMRWHFSLGRFMANFWPSIWWVLSVKWDMNLSVFSLKYKCYLISIAMGLKMSSTWKNNMRVIKKLTQHNRRFKLWIFKRIIRNYSFNILLKIQFLIFSLLYIFKVEIFIIYELQIDSIKNNIKALLTLSSTLIDGILTMQKSPPSMPHLSSPSP